MQVTLCYGHLKRSMVSRIEEVMVLLVLVRSHAHFTNEGLEIQKGLNYLPTVTQKLNGNAWTGTQM